MMRTRKMEVIEPFTPLEPEDRRTAAKKVSLTMDLRDAVAQYHLINTQIHRLRLRKEALRPVIIREVRRVKPDDSGNQVIVVDGKKVRLEPRYKARIIEDRAAELFASKGVLDSVAKGVVTFEVPASLRRKVARAFWKTLEKLGIENEVKCDVSYNFDEDKIERLYAAGDISDDEIDYIIELVPIGQGFALYVNEVEEETDEDED